MAISTPSHSINQKTIEKPETTEHVNLDVQRPTTNNEQPSLAIAPDGSIKALPVGIATNNLLSVLESILREKAKEKKTNQSIRVRNSSEMNSERINRTNFFFKNAKTSKNYLEVFIAIGTMYPLIQLNDTENSVKIQYLCVSGSG